MAHRGEAGRLRRRLGLIAGPLGASLTATAAYAQETIGPDGLSDPRLALGLSAGIGILVFGMSAGALYLRERARHARTIAVNDEATAALRMKLERAEAFLEGESALRIAWDGGRGAPLVSGDLSLIRNAARNGQSALAFGTWLDPSSASDLDRAVETLRRRGEGFVFILRTIDGRRLEATGKTAAGRAVLTLRDLHGESLERARLAERAAELKTEATALRGILGGAPMPVWRRERSGRLAWVNEAFARAVEAESPDAVVACQTELLDQSDRLRLAQARAGGDMARARVPAVVAGRRRALDVIERPDEQGCVGFALDMSELEAARAEMKRHIAAQARTLDQLTTAVAIFGADKRLRFHNAAYRDLFGLDTVWLASGPEDAAVIDRLRAQGKLPEQADFRAWKQAFLEVYRAIEPLEHWWHLPDGRTLRVVATPDPQGGVVYVFENHTERLDLESRYNTLFRVQGETLDNLHEGVAVFGSDGRVRLFNPALAAIWQLSPDMLRDRPHIDTISQSCADLGAGDGWAAIKRTVTALDDDRSPVGGRVERSDGTVIDYRAEPLPDGATLATFADVTAGTAMQRALEEKNEALEAADRLKNAFVQHVSYELRSPLTNIIGFAQLLGDEKFGQLSDKQRDYAGHILGSSAALLAIINDILDLATIDAGGMELELGDVDVRGCAEAAAEGVLDRVKEAGLVLDIDIADNVGTFRADGKRVRQVLYNLLSNAVGFSETGGRVRLACERADGAVRFTVTDEGRGIAAEDIAHVFERFESRSRGSHRGVGLGLSIVKSLVELHGGSVSIESVLGKGTEAVCVFPVAADAASRPRSLSAAGRRP